MRHAVQMFLLAGCCIACDSDRNPILRDKLTGCYALKPSTPADLKITKESGKYWVSGWDSGKWVRDGMSLVRPEIAALRKELKDDSGEVLAGLVRPMGSFGLFRLREGATIGDKPAPSEFAVSGLLSIKPAFQVACR